MVLNDHPQINESAVVGVPQPGRGENDEPLAFVVRRSDSLTEQDVMDYVAENLSDFKRLRGGVYFVSQLKKVDTPFF
jgi:4-coumarate--CoA ligase